MYTTRTFPLLFLRQLFPGMKRSFFLLLLLSLLTLPYSPLSAYSADLTGGYLLGWGGNDYWQLGNGSQTNLFSPAYNSRIDEIAAISGGIQHTLALKADGTVWSWGLNYSGQLGDGTLLQRSTPVQVSGLDAVVAIAAGNSHSIALKQDGSVWGWGRNNFYGAVGDGTDIDRLTPVQVYDLSGVTAISADENHSLALKADGTVWAWGYNDHGQLGDGTITNRLTPVSVANLDTVTAISAGTGFSLALKSDGTVWAWGDNAAGQLGDGTTTNRQSPVKVGSITGAVAISAGGSHSLALKADGTAWAWGAGGQGQLGTGGTTNSPVPVQVAELSSVTGIAAGFSHSVATGAGGTVWTTGKNSSGQLGYTTSPLTYRLTPKQLNIYGASAISGRNDTFAIMPFKIRNSSLPSGTVGISYSTTLSCTNTYAPFSWSVVSGSLPPGLSLNASGVISGTPTEAGVTALTFQATDGKGKTTTKEFTLGIYTPLTITTQTLDDGIPGRTFSQSITAAGGLEPYSWSVSSGSIPPGLTLNTANGLLSGVPTSGGTFTFTVKVTDGNGTMTTRLFSLYAYNILAAGDVPPLAATAGFPFSHTLNASGGRLPYSWSIQAGALPPDFLLGADTGVISGAPSGSGQYSFTVRLEDANGTRIDIPLTLSAHTSLTLLPIPIPFGVTGTPYTHTLSLSSTVSPYTWEIIAGSLPAGLVLNSSTGVISGTPTTAERAEATLRISDSAGGFIEQTLTIDIHQSLAITTTTLPPATFGAFYSQTLTASATVPPYSWSIIAGELPAGLTLNSSTGVISGTPAELGSASFTVQIADTYTVTAAKVLSLSVESDNLEGFETGNFLKFPWTNYGCNATAPIWSVTSDKAYAGLSAAKAPAPAGGGKSALETTRYCQAGNIRFRYSVDIAVTFETLSFFIDGVQQGFSLTGSVPWTELSFPVTAGLHTFHWEYSSSPGYSSGNVWLDEILFPESSAPDTIITATPPNPSWQSTGSFSFASSLPASTFDCSIDTGAFAPCTNPYHVTSLTPGNHTFSVKALNPVGPDVTPATHTWEIRDPVTITTGSMPHAFIGAGYNGILSATGGIPPYTWSLIAGSLPAGLALNSANGTITGNPTAAGIHNFSVQVSDDNGFAAARQLTLTAYSPPSTFLFSPDHGSAPLSVQFSADSAPTYSWDFGDGGSSSLQSPAHIYTVPGTYAITLTTTDQGGANPTTETGYVTISSCSNRPIKKLSGETHAFYDSLQTAYLWAVDDDTLQLQNGDFTGDLVLDREVRVTLSGGHDCGYGSLLETSRVIGRLVVSNGSVTVANLVIQ